MKRSNRDALSLPSENDSKGPWNSINLDNKSNDITECKPKSIRVKVISKDSYLISNERGHQIMIEPGPEMINNY